MDKRLLIVGLDPGTTLAYALLDVNGELVKLRSSKNFNFGDLIKEIIEHGKVVVVSSDVNPVPGYAKRFSSKFGAKLIYPDECLTILEKKKLVKDYEYGNKHEMDALSAAVFAYKKIRKLLDKVDSLGDVADDVKNILLTETSNISRAFKKAYSK